MKSLFNTQSKKPVIVKAALKTPNATKVKHHATLKSKLVAYSVALLLTVAAGATMFYQNIPLSGQVATTEHVYKISNDLPRNVEVPQGGILSIVNESNDIHVLFSDTFCWLLECFITPDLNPNSNYKIVVPLTVPVGVYEIRSLADKTFRGEITITAGSVLATLPPGTNAEFKNIVLPTHRAPEEIKPTYNQEAFKQAAQNLAQNPNTGNYSPTPPVENSVHTSAPGQPETGGWTIFIALISAFALLWFGARKRRNV